MFTITIEVQGRKYGFTAPEDARASEIAKVVEDTINLDQGHSMDPIEYPVVVS